MALTKYIGWLKTVIFMRIFSPSLALADASRNQKTIAVQRKSGLCRFSQPVLHHIGHSCDKLAIGRFSFVGADGVAEVAVQYFPVSSGPGR